MQRGARASKRPRDDSEDSEADIITRTLATAARRSRTSQDNFTAVLDALAHGLKLPSRALSRGPEFEEISPESAFAGCEYLESGWRTHRLTGKAAILKAMRACQEADEDEAHWSGPDGELLEAVARGEVEPRIRVMRAVSPFNPVALFTPPSELALAAVAAYQIEVGEPIALYLGDLVTADADDPDNTYTYELDADELRLRGYAASAALRVDASTSGNESRFINDCWTPAGLPPRTPNCYLELIFDGQTREFHLCFFASRRIRAGCEIIVDYGPDYWEATHEALLRTHAKGARRRGAPCA